MTTEAFVSYILSEWVQHLFFGSIWAVLLFILFVFIAVESLGSIIRAFRK